MALVFNDMIADIIPNKNVKANEEENAAFQLFFIIILFHSV